MWITPALLSRFGIVYYYIRQEPMLHGRPTRSSDPLQRVASSTNGMHSTAGVEGGGIGYNIGSNDICRCVLNQTVHLQVHCGDNDLGRAVFVDHQAHEGGLLKWPFYRKKALRRPVLLHSRNNDLSHNKYYVNYEYV